MKVLREFAELMGEHKAASGNYVETSIQKQEASVRAADAAVKRSLNIRQYPGAAT
jgi:hypothetical protein